MARTDDRLREAFNALLDSAATLHPGDSLPSELALSRRLGVSRTVVRAALDRMQSAGLLSWQGREKRLLRLPLAADRLPAPPQTLSDQDLEHRFLDWILRFDVPPGTALNVADLARRFGVSPPVLQAFLASLSRFGLVCRRPRGGWELLGFTRDFAIELSDFRLMLELNAVAQVVDLPPDHPVWPRLDALEQAHRQLADQIDTRFHDFSLLDEEFHTTLGNTVKNRFTAEFQKIIALIFHYHYQWEKHSERDRNLAAIHEHLRLIAALKSRDAAASLRAATDHLRSSKQTLLASLRDHAAP